MKFQVLSIACVCVCVCAGIAATQRINNGILIMKVLPFISMFASLLACLFVFIGPSMLFEIFDFIDALYNYCYCRYYYYHFVSKEWLLKIWSTVLNIQLCDLIISSWHSIQLPQVFAFFFGWEKKPPENNGNSNMTVFHSSSCGQARMNFLLCANEIKRNAMNVIWLNKLLKNMMKAVMWLYFSV